MKEYNTLKAIIDEIGGLISKQVTSSSPEFKAWYSKTARFLIKNYGEKSYEYKEFANRHFIPMVFGWNDNDAVYINSCKRGLEETKAVLSTYLPELKESRVIDETNEMKNTSYSSVFIVHGHNGEIREAVARLVEKQGILPIILMEQANGGATIIEKIEEHSDTSAAICLFTADDEGKAANSNEMNKRARQNVVFETGYFMGKLGRDKLVIVADSAIELPSDLQGVVYSNASNWKLDVLRDLKKIGYSIDYNKIDE